MLKNSKSMVVVLAVFFVLTLAVAAQQKADETVTCPVSGKEMKASEAKASLEHEGKTYYFCCEGCKTAFVKNPEKYTHTQEQTEAKDTYTCPMHPEVQSDRPGECPKCGMKLEKKMMAMHMHAEMAPGEKSCCQMMAMCGSDDVAFSVENLKDGVRITLTSVDADTVKKIQEHATKMKQGCTHTQGKEESRECAGCCASQPDKESVKK